MAYTYELIEEGSYNQIYLVRRDSKIVCVFKQQIPVEEEILSPDASEEERLDYISDQEMEDINLSLDTVERSLQVWKEINPELPAQKHTAVINGKRISGWVCAYIHGRQATDREIVSTLIDIKLRTGRILVDAVGRRNVLTPFKGGKPVCIDVGMAFKLDYEYGPLPRMRDTAAHNPQRDAAGIASWRTLQKKFSSTFFNKSEGFEHSVFVIKALLFLDYHRPNLDRFDFLEDINNAKAFAGAYDKQLEDPELAMGDVDAVLAKLDSELLLTSSKKSIEENQAEPKPKDSVDSAAHAPNALFNTKPLETDEIQESAIKKQRLGF